METVTVDSKNSQTLTKFKDRIKSWSLDNCTVYVRLISETLVILILQIPTLQIPIPVIYD